MLMVLFPLDFQAASKKWIEVIHNSTKQEQKEANIS